jgi:protein-L-isoaspartate(D-aspartate) O-methyltransferase
MKICWLVPIFFILFASNGIYSEELLLAQTEQTAVDKWSGAREKMVETQISARGITDEKVLYAMRKVPRHEFIPPQYRKIYDPYGDHPVPIGYNQTISQPYVVALMTQLLSLKEDDKVLEIGTGSGYQAAILAEIVKEVYTIEIIPELARRAQKTLSRLGYNNVKVKIGDGYYGWQEYAPFDAIIVTCAPDHIPKPLIKQLRDGGRMVIPVSDYIYQMLYLVKKEGGVIRRETVIPVLFVPMKGAAEEKR